MGQTTFVSATERSAGSQGTRDEDGTEAAERGKKRKTAEAEVLLLASGWIWEGRKGEALRGGRALGSWVDGGVFSQGFHRFEERGGLGG